MLRKQVNNSTCQTSSQAWIVIDCQSLKIRKINNSLSRQNVSSKQKSYDLRIEHRCDKTHKNIWNGYVILRISSSTFLINLTSFLHSVTLREIPFLPGAIPFAPMYISLISINGLPLNCLTWNKTNLFSQILF